MHAIAWKTVFYKCNPGVCRFGNTSKAVARIKINQYSFVFFVEAQRKWCLLSVMLMK